MSGSTAQQGKELRQQVKRRLQGEFNLQGKRPSVQKMINLSNYDRLPHLIPIRHARMAASPFAFYRGTASIMARDLFYLPHTGLNVQAIGDCHLMNFGGFATPERNLVFDANDFDETHPAPWEWDVKRLATSFVLAGRHNGMDKDSATELAFTVAQSYRKNMTEFAEMSMLDLWYMKFDFQSVKARTNNQALKDLLDEAIRKAEKSTHQQVFYKITQNVLGSFSIMEQPPLVYHPVDMEEAQEEILTFLEQYFETLQEDRRWLASQYKVVDVALKVVGVGSVGTRCFVVLMMNEKQEPLFLQVKEARKSVLEPYTEPSRYVHHGHRVVAGQRLVQAASDIFLGWSTGPEGRHFYLRQLRDRKIAPDVEHFDSEVLKSYARLCGRMLARAHAKTGNAAVVSGYMGKSENLDNAMSQFAVAYADQTEQDYEQFCKAIQAGKLEKAELTAS